MKKYVMIILFTYFFCLFPSLTHAHWQHGQGNGYSGFHENFYHQIDPFGFQPIDPFNPVGNHPVAKDLLRLISNRSMENPAHVKNAWKKMIRFAGDRSDDVWKTAAKLTPPVVGDESCTTLLVKSFIFDKAAVAHATLVNRWARHVKSFDSTYRSTTEILASLVDPVKHNRTLALKYARESKVALEIFMKKCSHFKDPDHVIRFVQRLMDVATRALDVYDAGEMEIKRFEWVNPPPPPPHQFPGPPPEEMAAPLTALGVIAITIWYILNLVAA